MLATMYQQTRHAHMLRSSQEREFAEVSELEGIYMCIMGSTLISLIVKGFYTVQHAPHADVVGSEKVVKRQLFTRPQRVAVPAANSRMCRCLALRANLLCLSKGPVTMKLKRSVPLQYSNTT